MRNYEQCVTNCGVNICKIYWQVSNKWSVFIWSTEEKSIEFNIITEYNIDYNIEYMFLKKNMPKHSILILVLHFGWYKKHQKYRIITKIFTQDLHKQISEFTKFTSQYGNWVSQICTSLKLENIFNYRNR